MASNKATASTVLLLLAATAAAAAVSTAADEASLPKPSAATWVDPSKPPNVASSSDAPPSLAASPPPASATCVTSLLDLSPCLSFFKDAGATAAPAGCCDGLRAIIDAQAMCLCHIVNHSLERAIGVNIPIGRAFHLARDICGLALPPEVITSCGNKDRVPPLYVCPVPSA